ncbi:terminase gpA endonuclease subunit [Oceanispirochaeta sp.]|jgi:phage terminase large subunit GpA-like protein|uniref:terminase gpA endonuclease subunit n=1 Tax=Oceanispirochaeta sp. TaxID=2035350 RepID=UPI00263525A4|nr:terminase gpA endonuclease subunit [Oceanispirochaeta sp.]MDA3958386.1 phage terminase large subunit family protein [Oceanispirochaeta sp.]
MTKKAAYQNAIDVIIKRASEIIPTEISRTLVSEWAEKNRVLKEGPLQGPFSFDFTPYLRELADCLSPSDDETREVVFMKPARIGSTVSIGENWIGAMIDAFPCDMGYITSDVAMAEIQMQGRIDSLINESGIGYKIGNVKKRDTQKKTMDKTVMKAFPGGSIMAGGPNSSFFKRSVGFKFLNVTEVDGFADNIGKEGDPVGLFRRRCGAFQNEYKILWESSPKLKHNSKILRLYKEGDQRKYMVECKHCGHMQDLRWGKKEDPGGLKFDHDDDDRLIEGSVHYECEECKGHWTNADKDFFLPDKKMGGSAYWKPTSMARRPGLKSYHMNALYAPIGFTSWETIAMEFLEIKHRGFPPLEFQVWINTVLGEAFEDRGERPKLEALLTRNRTYKKGFLPEEAEPYFLTLGADIQGGAKSRIECEIVAWGHDKVSWSVDYITIPGDTSDIYNECWTALKSIIQAEYAGHKIMLSGIDSGFRTQIVYEFCAGMGSNVFPVMGSETLMKGREHIKFFEVSGLAIQRLNVNTDLLKQETYQDLAKGQYEDGRSPEGYCHFPMDYTRDHYNRLTAESRVLKTTAAGKKYIWDAGSRRNEQLDCRVYNLALVYAYKQTAENYLKEAKIIDEELNFTWPIFWQYVKSEKKAK